MLGCCGLFGVGLVGGGVCVVAWVAWAVLRCVGGGVVSIKGGVVGCIVCCVGLGSVR